MWPMRTLPEPASGLVEPPSKGVVGVIFLVVSTPCQRADVRFFTARRSGPARLLSGRGLDGCHRRCSRPSCCSPVCEEYESVVIFTVGVLVATLMLALMSLSGISRAIRCSGAAGGAVFAAVEVI